jgi:peptidoglycan/LPS O-acetylase OafA/YrhL
MKAVPGITSGFPLNLRNKPSSHLAFLDGLRAVCAIVVVMDHAWLEVWPVFTGGTPPTGVTAIVTGWLPYGARFAVAVFILLSGFCLMLPVVKSSGALRGGTPGFFARRARRILPPFYAAMVFSLVLIWLLVGTKTGTHWDVSVPVTWRGVFANLFLVQDIFERGQINHAFWSIAVEWRIYFLFPPLVLLSRRFGGLLMTSSVIAASYVLWSATRRTFLAGATLHYVGLFALGMWGASIAYDPTEHFARWRRSLMAVPTGIVLPLACAALLSWLCYRQGGYKWDGRKPSVPFPVMDLLVCVSILPLLIRGCAMEGTRAVRLLGYAPLVAVGTFAYSVYLIHAPVLQAVWQYVVAPMKLRPVPTFLALLTIGLPVVLATSYVFFYCCERPFLRLNRTAAGGRAPLKPGDVGGHDSAATDAFAPTANA